jgi:hypothetical protein
MGSAQLWTSLRRMPAEAVANLLEALGTTTLDATGLLEAGILRPGTLDTIIGRRAHVLTHLGIHRDTLEPAFMVALRDLFWHRGFPNLEHAYFNAFCNRGTETFVARELMQSIFIGAPRLKILLVSFKSTSISLNREVMLRHANMNTLSIRGAFALSWRDLSRTFPALHHLRIDIPWGSSDLCELEIDSVSIFSGYLVREPLSHFVDELAANPSMLRGLRCLILHMLAEPSLSEVMERLNTIFRTRPAVTEVLLGDGYHAFGHYRRTTSGFVPFACGCTAFVCALKRHPVPAT